MKLKLFFISKLLFFSGLVCAQVGIGTDNPQFPLDVVGAVRSSDKLIVESESPSIVFKDTNGAANQSQWSIGTVNLGTDSRLLFQSLNDSGEPSGDYFAFERENNSVSSLTGYNNGSSWFQINNLTKTFSVMDGANLDLGSVITISNGKVGINKNAPAADLHVDGAIIIGDSNEYPAQVDGQCINPGEIAFSNGVFYGCGPNDGQGNFQGAYEWIPLNNE